MASPHKNSGSIYVADHPFILSALTTLRDEKCDQALFRKSLEDVGYFLGYEITRQLPISQKTIRTPLTDMSAPAFAGDYPAIVPILRAGLAMADGLHRLMPEAPCWHVGVARNEATLEPEEYYNKIPDNIGGKKIIVADPMLATGGSAIYVIKLLVERGANPKDIQFMGLVAAPEGIKALEEAFSDVKVYVAAVDDCLNEKGYIVPGLGDAGDRYFGTMKP